MSKIISSLYLRRDLFNFIMSIDPGGQIVNFDVGIYKGGVNDQGIPHGHGRLDYKEDDALSRKYYEGQWSLGKNTGQGRQKEMEKIVGIRRDVYK